ncbi:MAG: alpha/beta hydrolase [Bacteroidales bacterium]|nr:alpha/beta hydrolase [Bacteroidales bacterium]
MLQDAFSSISYMQNRKDLNTGKLIIYGQSLGGHLALVAASRNQDKIDGVVTEGAFTSHRDIATERSGFIAKLLVAEKYSGLKAVQEYNGPVMIIHSTNDEVVPFSMGERLFKYANDPKYFYPIDKCHMCGPLFYADSISHKIKQMLSQ